MKEKKPIYGEKTIQLTITLWTNKIAKKDGHIKPRTCWEHGMVTLESNRSHGIVGKQRAFRSIAHISGTVEDLLKDSNMTVLHGRYTKGLYSTLKAI